MKHLIASLFVAVFVVAALASRAPTNSPPPRGVVPLMVTTGGVIVAPANFKQANRLGSTNYFTGVLSNANHYLICSNGFICSTNLPAAPVMLPSNSVPALLFDGMQNYAEAAYSSSFEITSQISVVAWVNMTVAGVYGGIMAHGSGNPGPSWGWQMRIHELTNFLFGVETQDSVIRETWSDGSLSTNRWYMLAGTYDGTNVSLYVDGVLAGTLAASGLLLTNGLAVTVGQAVGTGFFTGMVGPCAVYDRALNAVELNACADPTLATNLPANAVARWLWLSHSGTNEADATGNGNMMLLLGEPLPSWTNSPANP